MTVSDMEIYEPQRQYLESLGLQSCSVIYYEQLCDSFIVAVESVFSDATEEAKRSQSDKNVKDAKDVKNDSCRDFI